jgi:hypothetical protein
MKAYLVIFGLRGAYLPDDICAFRTLADAKSYIISEVEHLREDMNWRITGNWRDGYAIDDRFNMYISESEDVDDIESFNESWC